MKKFFQALIALVTLVFPIFPIFCGSNRASLLAWTHRQTREYNK